MADAKAKYTAHVIPRNSLHTFSMSYPASRIAAYLQSNASSCEKMWRIVQARTDIESSDVIGTA